MLRRCTFIPAAVYFPFVTWSSFHDHVRIEGMLFDGLPSLAQANCGRTFRDLE